MSRINVIKFFVFLFFINTSFKSDPEIVYIIVEKDHGFSVEQFGRLNDYDSALSYPEDFGRRYLLLLNEGLYTKEISFTYMNNSPEWMDQQFEYKIVDQEFLRQKDFKDREWFDKTDYYEILETFIGKDKVIYLVDEEQIKDPNNIYMVRVYFNYPAEE
ncbi:MAG: hypothetical protein HC819_19370 [Cyclobacteriaceae bacterium]|nr:hypothetical protein [Cyclobacteriaceae bacterium]